MEVSPNAGKPADAEMLVNVPRLVTSYYSQIPSADVNEQRVLFGTSGHRGSSLDSSFNEYHILAITQAICVYRKEHKINGPLFLGIDTHALSVPAFSTALEVLAANEVEVMIADKDEYTPTPVISHAIINYNKNRKDGFADGIVITPSHNPPHDGGFKYNTPDGGPSASSVTNWIQAKANEYLTNQGGSGLKDVKRITFARALQASTTHRYDYLHTYIKELGEVINMDAIRQSQIKIGVDPLGGAGVHYWPVIAEQYKLNLTVVNKSVDPTFRFMTIDWDGQIRMDPSSAYAMQSLIKMKDQFDISFACDTDHDRHGIVTRSEGLLPPNHYLSAAISYLLQNRPQWRLRRERSVERSTGAIGKTVVSSQMIDRVADKLGRKIYEVPVGFKWFAEGLLNSSLCFGGEESAGASFSRLNGSAWTTDKDGIIPALLSAEMTAVTGRDPGELYNGLVKDFGKPFYNRKEASATPEQKALLGKLSPDMVQSKELSGERIESILTKAPGNGAAIGGLKVITKNGWFAARPSGTENIYKIYAESFKNEEHLEHILEEAQSIVNGVLEKSK